MTGDLVATGIVEKDTNHDVLWVWSYPHVSAEWQRLILRKCTVDSAHGKVLPFSYGQFQKHWFYLSTTDVFESDLLKIRQFVLVLFATDFNPEKYEVLCRLLSKAYCKAGSPVVVLQHFLSVSVHGSCSTEENGTFLAKDFGQRQVYSNCNVKDVIRTFQLETIIIFTALILKKRILVYHHQLDHLLTFLRALPAFTWHRQSWNILVPQLDLVDEELHNLQTVSGYVAGSLDAAAEAHSHLYEVFVNLAATEIAVAPHAKEYFIMSKAHKEIALFMVRLAEDDSLTDQQVIKEISDKTKELLNMLESLRSEGRVTMEAIRTKKFALALENFLYNIALAEGMIKL